MDGGFVELHFQAADADRTVAELAVVFGRLVLGRNAADAGGRDGVEIDRDFQVFGLGPNLVRKELDSRRRGGNYHHCVLNGRLNRGVVARFVGC